MEKEGQETYGLSLETKLLALHGVRSNIFVLVEALEKLLIRPHASRRYYGIP